ncbi:MAG TPA: hypothetical protein VK081_13460, partial [Planctomycetota bacterium]|nr:hypothetical protein [Planctomycetota bacterium]
LGAGDEERARVLANPGPADVSALAGRLRARLGDLDRRIDAALAAAHARIALGADGGTALHESRTLLAERAQVDAALSTTLDLLRPGAERRADQRTRVAARALGEARMAAVRARLLELGGEDLAERIELRRARPSVAEGLTGGGAVRLVARARTE